MQHENRGAERLVFIGGDYLLEGNITEGNLRSLIEKYSQTGTEPPWEMAETDGGGVVERFRRWGTFTIAAAGLAHGVNPCASAMVVFFVSYLAYIGRKRREIMLVGVSFILVIRHGIE